jgi:hypothetical protein
VKIGEYDTHPIADAFPLLQGEDFESFKADIEAEGLRDRDVPLYQGKLLDARNRYRVCLELGPAFVKKLRFIDFEGDPFAYVISRNILGRRHLNESQRAIIACRLATMKPGRPRKTGKSAALTQAEAAAALNVGERTVRNAQAVIRDALPDVVQAVERGELSLEQAVQMAKLPDDQQKDALARRKERVQRAQSKQGDDGQDPVTQLLRVIMRAAHELGASVKPLQTTNGRALSIGFRGEAITLTLSSSSGDEMHA